MKEVRRLPEWIKKGIGHGADVKKLLVDIKDKKLHTVCQEAKCPNLGECFKKKTATFMILGKNCTRNCAFCNVTNGVPESINENEPAEIADMIEKLGLNHAVITSVTRDDLEDGGATHFANVIRAIKDKLSVTVEVLTPDFKGKDEPRRIVSDANPDIFNHNVETVKELYSTIRPQANYQRSLDFLRKIKEDDPNIITKTGIMVGLGETEEQLKVLLEDCAATGVDIFTCGQYLRPTKHHAKVIEYKEEQWFEDFKELAQSYGIKYVFSAPFMRSSYNAQDILRDIKNKS